MKKTYSYLITFLTIISIWFVYSCNIQIETYLYEARLFQKNYLVIEKRIPFIEAYISHHKFERLQKQNFKQNRTIEKKEKGTYILLFEGDIITDREINQIK